MEVEIGKVTHYDGHIHVAVLMLKQMLKVGDRIRIYGRAVDFTQLVTSLEIDQGSVQWAQPGDDVALKVIEPVQVNDRVYRVILKDMSAA